MKNKKGFTLVELLAVIVVLAIVMGLAAVAITSVLNNTRKAAFVADAKTYLDAAHSKVQADDLNSMLGGTGILTPNCKTGTDAMPITYISLESFTNEKGGKTSPYGNDYLKGEASTTAVTSQPSAGSYVKIVAAKDSSTGACTYTYSIFLSDGTYAIGAAGDEVEENAVDNSKVLPVIVSSS